ncbi:MAG: VPLPA-CTERM sorting domain-containing protein [Pseudomonadota bacterium]
MRKSLLLRLLSISFLFGLALPAAGQSVLFSTTQPAAVDGPGGPGSTQFTDGDVVRYDTVTGLGTVLYLDDVINDGGLPDMNALYVRSNGNLLFSTQSGSANYPFQDDQIVEYDPVTDTLSLFYDFDGIITTGSDVDINGFHMLSNGNFLIANRSDFNLDSQSFLNGDIVEFDPVSQTASLFFSESLFEGSDDILLRSVSMLPNGNLLLSAFNEDTGGTVTLGGLTFGRGDLVEYDAQSDVASLYISAAIFGGATEEFDAVHAVVPVPAALWLLLGSLGALIGTRRRLAGAR